MSTKFEQLLDLIVNEEMDKANELFHDIVVEKSREIYENLIAEEAEEEMDEAADEDMDESADEEEMDESADDEEMDESAEEDTDESVDLEDSYMMDGDDEEPEIGGDATDDLGSDTGAGEDEQVIFDIKDAIEQLEQALANLEGGDMGGDDSADFGDDEMGADDEEEPSMMGFQEGRRMTREYVEKVGNDWEKNSQKAQGVYAGAGTGDKDGSPVEGRSPIASGKNKPGPAGVGAGNIAQNAAEGQSNTGTSPGKVNNGITKTAGEKFDAGKNGNVPGGKMGVKNLSKVAGGHGAEKKGSGPGPVGSGTGDKAGQTSVSSDKQFLKPYGN
jgi:hypothetical protein